MAIRNGDLSDSAASELVVAVLTDSDSAVVRSSIHGLIRVRRMSHQIEREVVRLGDTQEFQRDVYDWVLLRLNQKSPLVAEALLEVAEGPDVRRRQAAVRSLRFGVPPSLRAATASAMIRVCRARTSARAQRLCLALVGEYGDASHVPALEEIQRDLETHQAVRSAAQAAIGRIEKRAGR